MKTREIKITLSTAERWVNGNDTELKELALTTFPELGKKVLPKSWEALGEISGFYVDSSSDTNKSTKGTAEQHNKNTFATKEQAEASIALAQLSQLIKVYNDGWVADWSNRSENKYCIRFCKNGLLKEISNFSSNFLSFKDAETRDLFLENFSDLILTAKTLL